MAVVSAGMGAMSSLLSKLSALLSDEYKLLKRVRKDVEFLKRELSTMEALLQTLAGMDKLEALHKKWRNNVRELSYDIEDCIDRFMRHLGSGAADAGFMKKAVRQLKELRTRHYIASQIKELKVRVLEEGKRRYRYELDSSISRPITVDIDPRLPALYAEAKGLVAIDGPRDQIVGWLMDETVAELKVVSIVGCGGLGKTTLAMEVYRKIEENFRCRASVSVSRTLDLNKLLKDILFQVDKAEYSKCQSEMWEKEQLIRKLRHIFTGKRCHNFEDEDLHVLMGLPSLTHLRLYFCDDGEDTDDGEGTDDAEDIDDGEDTVKMITVGGSGFRLLEEFECCYGYKSGTMLVFGPGATPALRRLYVNISERETLFSKYCCGAGFGIEHLTNLRQFHVLTPTWVDIQALADAIYREITSHPNRQTLLVEVHAYDIRFFSGHEMGEHLKCKVPGEKGTRDHTVSIWWKPI